MNEISIRQGETLQLPIKADDDSAISVTFQVAKNGTIFIDETENFSNGKATIITNDTNHAIGEYEYMLTVEYPDATDKLPDPEACEDGECDLPKFIICRSLVDGVV